ncbi:MAG: glycosyltransferase family 39 protein, partial [Gammaproteobacteria bacterium]
MADRPEAAPPGEQRIRLLWHGALVVSLCVLVYGRVESFDYSRTDDFGYIILNGHVRSGLSIEGVRWALTAFDMSNWHPLTWISHMADVSMFGLEPGPRHIVNVVLHVFNSLLVWRLVQRLLEDANAALLVAALFAVHAIHVESVAWIAERKDLLCGLFFLMACIAHLELRSKQTLDMWLRVQFFALLALMSKPMAVTLPVVLLLLDVWQMRRDGDKKSGARILRLPRAWVLEKVPITLAALGVCVLTMNAQHGAIAPLEEVSVAERLANVPVALSTYLGDLLLPARLASFYPYQSPQLISHVLPSLILLAGISALCWRKRESAPWLALGWVWFLVTIAPVSGIVQVGSQSHADRYMYLPSIGILLWAGAMIPWLRAAVPRLMPAVCVVPVAFHTVMGGIQVGYWRDPGMIYGRILDVSGEHYTVSIGLSAHYLERGSMDAAVEHA